ncbi:DUF5431 family protein [Salmonella enterica subsp. enterica serovar Javiana]|nr:hypothetical protein [Salmonella enterica subsp. enterica serovar 9,12:-:1,5]EKR2051140.1 DUF5431 family protein [Salmonella enterica subsp. enterica serovar Javiana]
MAERRKAPSNFSINPRLNLDTRHIQISRLLREAQGEEGYETATKYSVLVRIQVLCVASRSMASSNCRIFWPLIRFLSNSGIRFRMVRETVARAMLRRIMSAFSYALYERRQTPSSSAALSRLQPRPFLHNLSSYPVISAIQKVQILHLF